MKKILLIATALVFSFSFSKSFADGHGPEIYGPYPITLKGYEGDETNSVKYTGQMARQVLHDSLKKLVKTGDLEKMMAYYNGEDGLEIIAPDFMGFMIDRLIRKIRFQKFENFSNFRL